jgi:glycosyltransferase involved in cell wall biosynthesis
MRLISICIPAYKRPEPLREALDSCLAQTYTNFEIVIGDDSPDDASERVALEYSARFPGKIKYQRNCPSLGQAGNVNSLFDRAEGELAVLLHDDDMLLPIALQRMVQCWGEAPDLTAAFGKQYVIDGRGKILPRTSAGMNVAYHRVLKNAGKQSVPAIAGLVRMFPNNGYMILTQVAREVRYRAPSEVGEACDTDFGLRVCLRAKSVWFLDEYTAMYRISEDAVSKRSRLEPFAYDAIEGAEVPPAAKAARTQALQHLAPGATSGFARLDRPERALSIFLSKNYRFRDKLRPRGGYHLLWIGISFFRRFLRRKATSPVN